MSEHHPLPIDPDPDPSVERFDPLMVVAVAVGGVAGAAARHAIAEIWPVEAGTFPWATFLVNVSGSLLLGLALVLLVDVWMVDGRARALVSTGLFGAFTTMSTFLVEVVVLGKDGHVATAVIYVVATVGAGLVAATVGIRLGRTIEAVPAGERVR